VIFAGLRIWYGFHSTPFGECLIAMTEGDVCAFAFVTKADRLKQIYALKEDWPDASFSLAQTKTGSLLRHVFEKKQRKSIKPISLHIKGTPFQLKVWKALMTIPRGAQCTYGDIAKLIDQPTAYRAVGSAVAKNPIGYFIPCHRVIRKQGGIGGYRWGAARKKALLEWENDI
jgi:AraC family transcriptional regulator of adaptative response/methylated-DNA-[protein]-cysteine methyltransferase